MADKKTKREKPRVLQPVDVGDYTLLNDEKVSRAFDKLGENATDAQLLAEYDRLGGAVKYEGRKLAMGTFFDFKEQKPREVVKLEEEQFEDEYVLQRKEKKIVREKGKDIKERVAKLGKKDKVVDTVEEKTEELTREEVRDMLTKKGIEFDGRANLETLKKLL